jgi:hypothetical protein
MFPAKIPIGKIPAKMAVGGLTLFLTPWPINLTAVRDIGHMQ